MAGGAEDEVRSHNLVFRREEIDAAPVGGPVGLHPAIGGQPTRGFANSVPISVSVAILVFCTERGWLGVIYAMLYGR